MSAGLVLSFGLVPGMAGPASYAASVPPPLLAPASAHPSAATPSAATGSITGTVTDSGGTHQGLRGVTVQVSSTSTHATTETTTAAGGHYTTTGLPPASDYVVCFDGGVASGGTRDTYGYAPTCFRGGEADVTVASGGSTQVNEALAGGGVLSGTVLDSTGLPLQGAQVSVTGLGVDAAGRPDVLTSADGTYRLTGIPAGLAYVVCFTGASATGGSDDARGYGAQCWDRRPDSVTVQLVAVVAGRFNSGINGHLPVAGAISGIVTDSGAGHHGLAGVTVNVRTGRGLAIGDRMISSTVTSANGSYTVPGLAPGTDYRVCFDPAGASGGTSDSLGYVTQCYANAPNVNRATDVVVTSGATTSRRNVVLAPAGAVGGRVVQSGGGPGLGGVAVTVSSSLLPGDTHTTTAADGTYLATGLTPGSYTVCYAAAGAVGGSSDLTGYVNECYDNKVQGSGTRVTVTGGTTRTKTDAALSAAGAISGTITDASGTHAGLANVVVSTFSSRTRASGFVTTSADGSYRISGLAAGPGYAVCFNAGPSVTGGSGALGYVGKCYSRPGTQFPTPVTVTGGAARASTDGALPHAGGIQGKVTDASPSHFPLANVGVTVSSTSGGEGRARTAADGTFTVRALPPGTTYTVCFAVTAATSGGSTDALGYVPTCTTSSTGSGASVAVVGDQTRSLATTQLTSAGAISGRVNEAAGSHLPLAGIFVQVFPSGLWGQAWTGPDGAYRIVGLPAGAEYRLNFNPNAGGLVATTAASLGYRTEWYNNKPDITTATPVAVTSGQTRRGANAGLAAAR